MLEVQCVLYLVRWIGLQCIFQLTIMMQEGRLGFWDSLDIPLLNVILVLYSTHVGISEQVLIHFKTKKWDT
jgi:hypothetical protein